MIDLPRLLIFQLYDAAKERYRVPVPTNPYNDPFDMKDSLYDVIIKGGDTQDIRIARSNSSHASV